MNGKGSEDGAQQRIGLVANVKEKKKRAFRAHTLEIYYGNFHLPVSFDIFGYTYRIMMIERILDTGDK
jgi:hypothetical protein